MPVTLGAAGILGLIYVILTGYVIFQRGKTKTMIGDGGNKDGSAGLQVAIRMHGNFAEFVPLALILLGGIEEAGAPHGLVLGLGVALVLARIAHPFGMVRPAPNLGRAFGVMVTLGVMIVASVTGLLVVFK